MLKLLKSITSPLLSLAIVMIAVGIFSTFIPLRLTLDGHNTFIVGGVTAAYFAGLILGSVRTERFIAQVGHIRTFSAFAALSGAICLTMGLIVNPAVWIFSRFLMGIFTSGLFIVIESWLLMVGGEDKKGTILAYYMIAFYSAQAGGQFLLSALPPTSLIPFNIAALFVCLSVVPVALTKYKSPTVEEPSLLSPLKLLKASKFGILSCFGSGLIMGAFFGLTPVFASKIGMLNSDIPKYIGVTIIGGFVLQWPLGRLSDRINRRTVLIGVSLLTSCFALLMAISALISTDILFVLAVIFGGFAFTMYPMSISYTNDFLDKKDLIAATGGLLLVYGVGSVIGPLVAPLFMKIIGPSGLYVYFSIIAAFVGTVGVLRRNLKKPLSIEQQATYRSVPRTTPKVSELVPREEETQKVAEPAAEKDDSGLEEAVKRKSEEAQQKAASPSESTPPENNQ